MAKGGGGGGGRDGTALKTAVIVTGGLALAWVTVEAAFRPFLDRLRAAASRSTDPSRDPDLQQEDPAPAPAAAPAAPAEEVEEKAPAAAEPSAPPVPVEEGENVVDEFAELEEKPDEPTAKAD